MQIVKAQNHHLREIRHLLEAGGLPVDDLESGDKVFFICHSEGAVSNNNNYAEKLAGVIGIEQYGEDALLRSLAVTTDMQGQGVAGKLLAYTENYCQSNGINRLYLLTQTVPRFFRNQGYVDCIRETVPRSISLTEQFRTICPSDAVCLTKTLSKQEEQNVK